MLSLRNPGMTNGFLMGVSWMPADKGIEGFRVACLLLIGTFTAYGLEWLLPG